MATRGRPALTPQEAVEVVDLYCWGARVSDICMLYDIHKRTMKGYVQRAGRPLREKDGRPFAEGGTKRDYPIKSIRPKIPVGVRCSSDADPSVDQLVRMSAHAQRDMRIAQRLSDGNTGSCPVSAS